MKLVLFDGKSAGLSIFYKLRRTGIILQRTACKATDVKRRSHLSKQEVDRFQ